MADDLLHQDERLPHSEPVAASGEIGRESAGGAGLGLVTGALLGVVLGAVLFGFPTGGQSSRDTTLFLLVLFVVAFACTTVGFVFGGGRGVRDARRQAEAEAHGRA
jgi:hypothetical protein